MKSLIPFLQNWNMSFTERTKLQHVYIALVVIAIVVGGVVSLVYDELGHEIVVLGGYALGVFVVNALVWALVRVYLLGYLERTPAKANKK